MKYKYHKYSVMLRNLQRFLRLAYEKATNKMEGSSLGRYLGQESCSETNGSRRAMEEVVPYDHPRWKH